jgi:hypothetical protein
MRWYAGIVVSIWLSAAVKCNDFDPLKQFPRVTHGNHPVQGRIAMGSPPPNGTVTNPIDLKIQQEQIKLDFILAEMPDYVL